MPPAQRELQLDSQFAAAEKAANAPNKLIWFFCLQNNQDWREGQSICNYFHLSATKAVKQGPEIEYLEMRTANLWLCDWVRSVGQQMIDSSRRASKLSGNMHTTTTWS